MAEASAERPSAPSSGWRTPRFALALWGLSIAIVVTLVAVGLVVRQRRPPLPVIKEVPAFALTHHDGSTVSAEDLRGAPWVADFIFTRCPAICPRMTSQMKRVADALDSSFRTVSISVDPQHDTPEVLRDFAAKHGAGDGWYFLTGDADAIGSLCREGFLLALDTSPPPDVTADDGPILHSNRFVLVDAENRIRGYYDPFDEAELKRLVEDARRLPAGG